MITNAFFLQYLNHTDLKLTNIFQIHKVRHKKNFLYIRLHGENYLKLLFNQQYGYLLQIMKLTNIMELYSCELFDSQCEPYNLSQGYYATWKS